MCVFCRYVCAHVVSALFNVHLVFHDSRATLDIRDPAFEPSSKPCSALRLPFTPKPFLVEMNALG